MVHSSVCRAPAAIAVIVFVSCCIVRVRGCWLVVAGAIIVMIVFTIAIVGIVFAIILAGVVVLMRVGGCYALVGALCATCTKTILPSQL